MTMTSCLQLKRFHPRNSRSLPTWTSWRFSFLLPWDQSKTHPTPATPSAFCFHLSSMTVGALPSYSLDVTSGNVSQTCFLSFKSCHNQGYRLHQVLMTPSAELDTYHSSIFPAATVMLLISLCKSRAMVPHLTIVAFVKDRWKDKNIHVTTKFWRDDSFRDLKANFPNSCLLVMIGVMGREALA